MLRKNRISILLSAFVFLIVLTLHTPASAGSSTYVKGIIATDTTWTLANSPYIVTAPTVVESGATLTIEPGVEVKFAEGSKLTVEGRLQAIGTPSNKIKFTSDSSSLSGMVVASGTLQYGEFVRVGGSFTNTQISNSYFSQSGGRFYNTTVSNSNISQGGSLSFENATVSNSNFTRNTGFSFYDSTVSRSRFYNNARTSSRFDLIPNMIYIVGASTFNHNAVFSNLSTHSGYLGTPTIGPPVIYLSPNSGRPDPKLTHNLIYGNPSGGILSTGATTIQYNNIYNNGTHDLGFSLDRGIPTITNNWWGTADTAIIEKRISGLFDEYGRKRLEYMPILTSLDPEAPTISLPTISSVSPNSGANDTTTNITIAGTNFRAPQSFEAPLLVTIGTTSATSVNLVNVASLTATVPSGIAAGTYDVTVTNPDGLSATLPKAFTVIGVLPTGEISGRVVNQAGQPISGVAVRINNTVVSTNGNGEFRFTSVHPGIYTIYYDASGYVSQTQVIEVKAGVTTRPPTVVMSPGFVTATEGEIYGRVVNSNWQPILGTAVRINNVVIPTNPGGEFRFTLVYPGIYTIYYDAPGYISQTQVVEVKAGATTRPPTVIMSRLGEIFGKVINGRTRRPFRGAVVRINNVVVPTNRRGEFRFTQVYPGIYTIYYDAPGYRSQIQEFIAVYPDRRTIPPTCILFP